MFESESEQVQSNVLSEPKSIKITGLFEKDTTFGKKFVGGRIRAEELAKLQVFADKNGGLDELELVVEENRFRTTERQPAWNLIVKKKFQPRPQGTY